MNRAVVVVKMVSMLAFQSDNLSSNPTDVYKFLLWKIVGKNKINEKETRNCAFEIKNSARLFVHFMQLKLLCSSGLTSALKIKNKR